MRRSDRAIHTPPTLLGALTLMIALVATACSGDQEPVAEPPATEAVATTATAQDPTTTATTQIPTTTATTQNPTTTAIPSRPA